METLPRWQSVGGATGAASHGVDKDVLKAWLRLHFSLQLAAALTLW